MDDQAATIRLERSIPRPPAEVWAVLTQPATHALWWAAGEIRPVAGHRFALDMGPWGQQPCQILAVEPERLLRYSFAPDTLGTTITWRLARQGKGTRLTFEQAGFDLASAMGQAAFQGMGAGWPQILQRLSDLVMQQAWR